jgi:hypothetical protein
MDITLLGDNGSTTSTESTLIGTALNVTLSRTLVAGALALCHVQHSRGDTTNPTTPTVAGGGMTWVLDTTNAYKTSGTARQTHWIFRGVGTPSGTTITVTPGNDYSSLSAQVVECDGAVVTGTTGSDGIIQSVTNTAANADTVAAAMSTLNDSANAFVAFGVFVRNSTSSFTATTLTSLGSRVDFNEYDLSFNRYVGIVAQYEVGTITTDPSISHTTANTTSQQAITGLEIVADTEPSGPSITPAVIAVERVTDTRVEIEIVSYDDTAGVEHDMYRHPTDLGADPADWVATATLMEADIDPTEIWADDPVSPNTTYFYALRSHIPAV